MTPSNTTVSRECRHGMHWHCPWDVPGPDGQAVRCACACHRPSRAA